MTAVTKCDVCGIERPPHHPKDDSWGQLQLLKIQNRSKHLVSGLLDLCPKCSVAINDFLESWKEQHGAV